MVVGPAWFDKIAGISGEPGGKRSWPRASREIVDDAQSRVQIKLLIDDGFVNHPIRERILSFHSVSFRYFRPEIWFREPDD